MRAIKLTLFPPYTITNIVFLLQHIHILNAHENHGKPCKKCKVAHPLGAFEIEWG